MDITPEKKSLLTFSFPISVLHQAHATLQWMQALEFRSRSESACSPNQGLSRTVAAP